MQGDYFSKLQQQQPGTPTPTEVSTGPGSAGGMSELGAMPEDLQMADEDFEAMGLPSGNDPEANKQRIIALLKEAGILEGLSEEENKEIMAEIDKMLKALEEGNIEAFQKNPVTQLVGSLMGGAADVVGQQEGAVESDQPTDMAAMAGMGNASQ